MNTGFKTRGGKEIHLGDIVRPCKRTYRIGNEYADKTWRVELRKYPFVLVDNETGKPYEILEPWLNGELVIIGHVND